MSALRRALVPLLLVVVVISLPGCGRTKGMEMPFETIDRGMGAGRRERYESKEPGLVIIASLQDFALFEDDVPRLAQKLKDIDYSQFYVVAVFQGRKPTGAYEVEIQGIRWQDDVVTIYSRFATPEPGQERTLVETSPYHLVKIRKGKNMRGEFEFVLDVDGKEVVRKTHFIP